MDNGNFTAADVQDLVRELDALAFSSLPGAGVAYGKLKKLASTTGPEWDALVTEYLSQRRLKDGDHSDGN